MRLVRGVLASFDKDGQLQPVVFQYNPESVKRVLRPQTLGGSALDTSKSEYELSDQAPSYIDAPAQTLTITAYFDAVGDENIKNKLAFEQMQQYGIAPQLAMLEKLVYPTRASIEDRESKRAASKMPLRLTGCSPRAVLIWGDYRVLPVRVTSLDITEDVFDAALNPLRATVVFTLEVQTYANRAPDDDDYGRFGDYHRKLEMLAKQAQAPSNKERQRLQSYLAR